METKIKSGTLMTGMFRDRIDADNAYKAVQMRGYASGEIYVLMSEETRTRNFHDGHGDGTRTTSIGNKALEGAGTGGAVGIAVGAIAAAIAAVGSSLVIPGLGL